MPTCKSGPERRRPSALSAIDRNKFVPVPIFELRAADVLGRVGGEEFALLLPETGLVGGADIAERIRQRIAGQVFAWDGKNFGMTTSIGVAAWDPAEPTIDPVLARGDKGLYAAKDQGRTPAGTSTSRRPAPHG